MITFQQLIHRLTQFWEKKDCVIHVGHDLETGAGTFNPATFLRSLGPEPYRTAYVEPSRRPSDGRYGENPNRVQLFHQFQVIIKPSPADIQEQCLKCLEAIGLKLKDHDIRFVHDDWESPTLGAWGLGWEVWCDGMEICQFTYFQAIGSLPLKPIPAELTFGLERVAMFVQNVDRIMDIRWNETLTLGDISKQTEVEWSAYNFTHASTEMWTRHFDDYEKEAKSLIAKHLPLPAYDFVVKASHAFNMLDSRGVISVTERTGYIARIRDLARLIALEYLASREKQGFPLLEKHKEPKLPTVRKIAAKFNAAKSRDFLLEIGSEQLPATFIPIGCRNLEKAMRQFLSTHNLGHGALHVYGTPQRLAILVKDLKEGSASKTVERRGPALSSAFDDAGNATPQGQGFFKSLGLSNVTLSGLKKIKELSVKDNYLFATLKQEGVSTAVLLQEHLPSLILNLDFPKKMRWGNLDISYPRPLHWITALYGSQVVPFVVGDILSSRNSRGHAQRAPKKLTFKTTKDYLPTLRANYVLADIEERKEKILSHLAHMGHILEQEKVLAQVLYLTEWPELAVGTFDAKFLKIPQEVLISEMVEHQKYFPVANSKGVLQNKFIITADNKPTPQIIKGNEKVLSARLSDGAFLYAQDLKHPLEQFNKKLAVMTFQKELGSMLAKVERIGKNAHILNRHLKIADEKKCSRAALLCKSDLASELVKEFPELQGIIGKYYAEAQHEDSEVALAIEEHWFPKFEGAPLPTTATGIVLRLADKIDNLLSYYSIGLKPTSSSDPYSLRRQTIGIIKMLLENKTSINLKTLLQECAPQLNPTVIDEILHFITQRAKMLFEDAGFKKDEVEASLKVCTDPYDQFCKVQALHTFRKTTDFAKLHEVYKRAKGQLGKPSAVPFNPSLAKEPAEKALVAKLEALEKRWKETLSARNYTHAFHLMAELQPHLAHLFDTVKILDEDLGLRANRIALLQKVFAYFEELLNFGAIQEL